MAYWIDVDLPTITDKPSITWVDPINFTTLKDKYFQV